MRLDIHADKNEEETKEQSEAADPVIEGVQHAFEILGLLINGAHSAFQVGKHSYEITKLDYLALQYLSVHH